MLIDSSDKPARLSLPPELQAQFAVLEQRLWKKETIIALCGAVVALLVSYSIVFISDRLWDTPALIRAVVGVGGLALLSWFGWRWWMLWKFRRRDIRDFSRLVQKYHRRLGDRLLGIVELADETNRPADMSPTLVKAAIKQVAAEAAKYDFGKAVDPKATRRFLMAAAILAGLIALPWILTPEAGWNVLKRWLNPSASVPRYTYVEFKDLPEEMVVAQGEPFEVKVGVNYRSFWKPEDVTARFAAQPELKAPARDGQAQFEVPGQTETGPLSLKTGDAHGAIQVKPMHRPFVRELKANVTLPEYLGYPDESLTVENAGISVLSGSKVSFSGTGSRELASVDVRWGEKAPEPLEIQQASFKTGTSDVDELPYVSFSVRDPHGLTNQSPSMVTVRRRQDFQPDVDFTDLQMETAILESDILSLKPKARDDFGVREIGVRWNIVSSGDTTNAPIRKRFHYEPGLKDARDVTESFLFSPSVLDIPTDTSIELVAYTNDYLPGRDPVESMIYRLYVIDLVRHAEWIRQNLEGLFAQVEEVTRQEETIAGETRELNEMTDEQLKEEKAADEAGRQRDEQQQNARMLEELAREGAKSLREALRNPTFDEKTLEQWAQTLSEMQQIARNEMKQASQTLAQAQENKSERREKLEEAQQAEEDAIKKLQDMQEQMNEGLNQLEALTLAQRLRKLADEEEKLEGQLLRNMRQTIGLMPDLLSDAMKAANADLAEDQGEATEKAKTLQGEISRFFERTQREAYGTVSKEMEELQVELKLIEIRELIDKNNGMNSVEELGVWYARFRGWADLLQPKPQDSEGGEGEGESVPQDDMMKLLIGLIRMRADQDNIRGRTKLLEEQKADDPYYVLDARDLGADEGELVSKMGEMRRESQVESLAPLLGQAQEMMKAIQGQLGKPETGETVQQLEADTVQLLTDLINLVNEQSQQPPSGQQAQQPQQRESIEFLLEMVEQQAGEPGQMPGGQQPGTGPMAGDRTGPGGRAGGEGLGRGQAARRSQRGSGQNGTRAVPTEFKQAFESYFKAVEGQGGTQ